MSSLTVNDILEELLNENNRILNELLFAHKCITKSLEFKEFIDSIDKEFIDQLNPNLKKRYEELSRGFNLLIDQKWANISDNSPNESKTMTMSKTSDYTIERDSDYHTTNEDNVTEEEEYINEESLELEMIRVRTENFSHNPMTTSSVGEQKSSEADCHTINEDNVNDKEADEEQMISEDSLLENTVTLNNHNNYEGSIDQEALAEEPVIEKLSVRTKNISLKPMTTSSVEAVGEQQSSDDFNLWSKPSAKQKSKPKSRRKKKLFSFKCGFDGCNAVFRKRKAMIAHKKLHLYKCNFPGCDFQNKYKSNLKLHLIRHSNDTFECQHCHKKYKYNHNLRHHMKKWHLDQCPNDPLLVCDWNECQYTTKSQSCLNRHKRVHTLRFECRICKQTFSAKFLMESHLISKHNDK